MINILRIIFKCVEMYDLDGRSAKTDDLRIGLTLASKQP